MCGACFVDSPKPKGQKGKYKVVFIMEDGRVSNYELKTALEILVMKKGRAKVQEFLDQIPNLR